MPTTPPPPLVPPTMIHVLISEGDPGDEDGQPAVISAHRLISDALRAREEYIDEAYADDDVQITVDAADIYSLFVRQANEVVETLSIQTTELS